MSGEWRVSGYRHVRELGQGSAGRVVLAVHEATDIPVAIKYLSARVYDDADFADRFRAEARLLAEIEDPHLVRFYEYVEFQRGAAIVMELINGVGLDKLIKAEGATGPEAALTVLKGSLLGLGAAHLAGVVHRDYKPGNVLIRGDGVSKLADFGIAVRAGEDATAAGTPAYMSPEQWAGRPVTPAADVYAATAVFYECLTGERPFRGRTLPELVVAHRSAPIPVKRVPDPLRDLVSRGLAKDPAARPASAAEFLDRLETAADRAYGAEWERRGRDHLAERAAILALGLIPKGGQGSEGATALAVTELGRLGQKGVRRGLVAAAAGVAAVVLAGGGVAVYAAGRSPDRPKKALAAPSTSVDVSKAPSVGPSDEPSPTPSETPSTSPAQTPSPGPTVVPSTPAPAPGGSPPRVRPGTGPVQPPPRPGPGVDTPATTVTAIEITSWARRPKTLTGDAAISVTTDGRGRIRVLYSITSGGWVVDGGRVRKSGARSYDFAVRHVFTNGCEPWTITVLGLPGGASQTATIEAEKCDPQVTLPPATRRVP
ncbi:MAG: hypothetical protein JWO67_3584 [Streptosporangiaceae bacterium]|nr:hypothetical protein [Streptosporangiaceae bacterium]